METDWIAHDIGFFFSQSAPEACAALESSTGLQAALAPLVAWGALQLRDGRLDRDSFSTTLRLKLTTSALAPPVDTSLSGNPDAWAIELDQYFLQASPERHALLAAEGSLSARLDEIARCGQKQITTLDLQSVTFYVDVATVCRSMLSEAMNLEIRQQAPLGDDPQSWAAEIRAFFKTSSPENYTLAEQQGRLEANLAQLVDESQSSWDAFLNEENPDAVAKNTFKNEKILARIPELNRSVVRLKTVHRPITIERSEFRQRSNDEADRLSGNSPDFYLFGPARSGTTIIGATLSTSPDIFVLNDTMVLTRFFSVDFMIKMIGEVGDKQGMRSDFLKTLALNIDEVADVAHVKWLLSLLVTTYYGAGTNPDEPNKNLARFALHADLLEVDKILSQARKGCSWREIFDLVYASLVPPEISHARLLGEKTPDNVKFHGFLAEQYPKSRAVCVVRHPVNNIMSIYRRYPVKDIDKVVEHYVEYINPVMAMDQKRTLFIRYEDFVSSPAREMDRTADFLDVPRWEIPDQISAYNMPEYTGSGIDKTRNQNVDSVGDRELATIRAATGAFCARFYPEN